MPKATSGRLTQTEWSELDQAEGAIERGRAKLRDGWLQIGKALARINAGRLYRHKFETFEVYCQERWGYERAHAYRLLRGAETADGIKPALSPVGDISPESERQIRPLTQLPPEQRQGVWNQAVEAQGGPPTAETLEILTRKALAGLTPEEQRATIEESEAKARDSRREAAAIEELTRLQRVEKKADKLRKAILALIGPKRSVVAIRNLERCMEQVRRLAAQEVQPVRDSSKKRS